jgi:hypothetical protein
MEDFSSKDALRTNFKVNLMLELKGNNFTHTLHYITLNHPDCERRKFTPKNICIM